MSDTSLNRLREIQTQIERAAQTASTRAELINLRALWGSVQTVLDIESNRAVESSNEA